MSELTSSPEYLAAQQATAELEAGRSNKALDVLRSILSRNTPPPEGQVDTLPEGIRRLRAYMEQSKVDLEHRHQSYALYTLRRGLAGELRIGQRIPRRH